MKLFTYIKAYILSKIQDKIIFIPKPPGVEPIKLPSEYGLKDVNEGIVTTEDNVVINYWIKTPSDISKPFIVFFHGNAGHFGDLVSMREHGNERGYRLHLLQNFADAGYGFIAVSLRGYGKNLGIPSEEGFKKDVEAIAKLIKEQNYKTIALGESIGAFSALYLMQQMEETNNLTSVVLLAPFINLLEKTYEIYNDFRKIDLDKFLKYRFDNMAIINKTKFKGKILLIHGTADIVSGHYHSEKLYAAANERKLDIELVLIKDAGHVTWNVDEISKVIFERTK